MASEEWGELVETAGCPAGEGRQITESLCLGRGGASLASATDIHRGGQSGKHDNGAEVPVNPLVSQGLTVFAGRTYWCSQHLTWHHTDNGF